MHFFIFTIFPDLIGCFLRYGIVRQAIKKGKVKVEVVDLRAYAPKGQVDDEAYGGLPGMVLKPEPFFNAYEEISKRGFKPFVIATEPWGKRLTQEVVYRLRNKKEIAIFCGRYEGIDERVKTLVDEEISLGDFILSGGEVVAMAIIEAVARTLEGVLSEPKSLEEDSFSGRWIGYPVYTRPREFKGMKVPEVLTSGDHAKIELWKLWHRIENTLKKRPDLIPQDLTPLEQEIVSALKKGLTFEEWITSWRPSSS